MSVWKQSSTTNKILLGVLILVFVGAFLLLILNLTGSFPFSGSTSPGETVLVVPTPLPGNPSLITTSNVNIRSGPGTEYLSYGILVEDQTAQVVGVSPDKLWWVIAVPSLESGQGWLSDEFVTVENSEDVPVIEPPQLVEPITAPTPQPGSPSMTTLTVVNVRSGPGTEYKSYGLLETGQTAMVMGVSPDDLWWVIDLPAVEEGQGWVSAGYVSTENVDDVPIVEPDVGIPTQETTTPGAASLTAKVNADIHSNPGIDFYVFGVLGAGEVAEVTGVSADGLWWLISVDTIESGQGWVSAELVTAENTDGVSVVASQEEPTPDITPAPDSATVSAIANVNIRSGPGSGYGKVGLLENGQVALLLGISPDRAWWLIRIPTPGSGQGWISAQYVLAKNSGNVQVISPESGAVVGPATVPTPEVGEPSVTAITNVNIRSGPDLSFEVIGLLGLGQQAAVVGVNSDGSWWAIDIPSYESGRGWISTDYVTAENTGDVPVVQ